MAYKSMDASIQFNHKKLSSEKKYFHSRFSEYLMNIFQGHAIIDLIRLSLLLVCNKWNVYTVG